MHNLFAGLVGMFASIGSFFHGGQPANHQPMMNNVVMNSTATPSGTITPGFRRGMVNIKGERPFFGTVTAISGSTITIQMQGIMRMIRALNPSITPTVTITPPTARTLTITVDSSTTYTGGTLSSITVGTKIAGIGKTTDNTTIAATKIDINPTLPSGTPPGMMLRGLHSNREGQGFQGGQGRGMMQGGRPDDDQGPQGDSKPQ